VKLLVNPGKNKHTAQLDLVDFTEKFLPHLGGCFIESAPTLTGVDKGVSVQDQMQIFYN